MRFPAAGLLLLVVLGFGSFGAFVRAQAPTTTASPPPATKAAKAPVSWDADMLRFDEEDRVSPPPTSPIVFTGSSSIRRWDVLLQDFPKHRVLNRGFGGSQLSDLRKHFDRAILRYNPRQVAIYSGSNDIDAGKSVESVVDDLKAIVGRIHQELPKTRVLYISNALNPARWAQRDKVIAANKAIAEFLARDPRDAYVDVTAAMLGEDGQPKPEIFVADRLHMNRKGYELWIPLIEPLLVAP